MNIMKKCARHSSVFVKISMSVVFALCSMPVPADDGIVGFVNYNDLGLQGVTGGMDGEIVHVSTYSDLKAYCGSSLPYTIIIDASIDGGGKNDVTDNMSVKSNKTIIAKKGVTLDGICLDVKSQQNIILRNITLTHGKPDGMAFRTCHHIWVDHCDLSTCDDGLLDFTIGSSYLTVSWSAFHDHDKVSLSCSGTQHYEDIDKNRVTYHHNHYYNGTQRNPRIGYGLGHLWNNYWNHNVYNGASNYCVGYFNGARVLVENSYFTDVNKPFNNMYGVYEYDSSWAQLESRGNVFGSNVTGDRTGTGKSFNVNDYYDYDFSMQDASTVNDDMLAKVGPQDWVVDDIYGFPGNGTIDMTNLSQLKWSAAENATNYELLLGTDKDHLQSVQSGSKRTYDLPTLSASTTYFWKVKTTLQGGNTIETALWRFTTGAEKATKPTPADGDTGYQVYQAYPHGVTMEGKGCIATEAGMLSWVSAVDAKKYMVYIAPVADGVAEEMKLAGEVTVNKFVPSEPLKLGTKYLWRVDIEKNDGTTVEGDVWSFCSGQKLITEGKTETESMLMYGQTFLEWENGSVNWGYKASGDFVTTGEAGTGTLAGTYNGNNAICKVTYCYFDEKQGQGIFQLRVNNKKIGQFTANLNTNKLAEQSFDNVTLLKGDQIACDFLMQDKMKCRMDYINVTVEKLITDGIESVNGCKQTGNDAIYNLAGQQVDKDYKGIVIKGGKKYVVK